MENDEKKIRATPYGQFQIELEVIVKLGRKRHPLSLTGARKLRDELNAVLK
jgi:hypothetical protein